MLYVSLQAPLPGDLCSYLPNEMDKALNLMKPHFIYVDNWFNNASIIGSLSGLEISFACSSQHVVCHIKYMEEMTARYEGKVALSSVLSLSYRKRCLALYLVESL
jgi:hypothetical protein